MPGLGWWGVDPTNAQPVGELHVKIGHGQDYQDVMPLRGVYHGGADHQLGVQVRISRERLSQMAEQWRSRRFLNGFIIDLGSLPSRSSVCAQNR
jgi:transglutaminase-like putative cysteine protease